MLATPRRLFVVLAAAVVTFALWLPGAQAGTAQAQTPVNSTPVNSNPVNGTIVPPAWPTITLAKVAEGFSVPLYVTSPHDGTGRLFVVEQGGTVRIVEDGALLADPFLDIADRVNAECNECGLLSIAFPPDFASSQVFYVSYTGKGNLVDPEEPDEPNPADGNDSVLARFKVSAADPNRADPASEERLLLVNQPYQNHNGGLILFGPDDMLYMGLGDGGSRGDPLGAGQRLDTLLGKVLRLQVDSSGGYTIPADNPFAGATPGRDEIWDYGVRNPWRFSFDSSSGDFWLADVGQNAWEEVNFVPAAQTGGQNFGWNVTEGTHCYPPSVTTCDKSGFTLPVHEYGRGEGQSITGGYVYRGAASALRGIYLFGDYNSGRVWGLRPASSGGANAAGPAGAPAFEHTLLLETGFSVASFGEDEEGNLYIVNYGGGVLYRVVPPTTPPPPPPPDQSPRAWLPLTPHRAAP